MRYAILIGSVLGFASGAAFSATVRVDYTAELAFDPEQVVGVGGENAATLIDELFGEGIGASGSARISGSFTYDDDTPAFNSNTRGAGYQNAITSATLTWGDMTATADLEEIAANAATSDFGYNTNEFGGFCGSREGCAAIGQAFTPSGNRVQIGNDTDFFIIQDGNQVTFSQRDFVSLAIGATDSAAEFVPEIVTDTFGLVSIDGVSNFFVSNSARSLLDSVALPGSDEFVTSDEVEASIFALTFNGDALLEDLRFEGETIELMVMTPDGGDGMVDPTEPETHVIPLPASAAMMLGAFAALCGLGYRRRLRS